MILAMEHVYLSALYEGVHNAAVAVVHGAGAQLASVCAEGKKIQSPF